MKFQTFAEYLSRLESLASRNEMVVLLGELLNQLDKNEVRSAMYLLGGRVCPDFLPIEFGFSNKLIIRALSQYAKIPLEQAEAGYKTHGDIGKYTEELAEQKSLINSGSGVAEVYEQLSEIALTTGKNSQAEKQRLVIKLLEANAPVANRFLTRMLTGKMRLGLSAKTILDGISWAMAGDKSLRPQVEYAYGVSADIGLIAETAMKEGLAALEKSRVQPGFPVASKLVEREKTPEAIIARMGSCYIQPKFDGLRVQIHYNKDGLAGNLATTGAGIGLPGMSLQQEEQVRIFSRNMENLTPMFPELVAAVKKLGVDSLILDGEAIGFDEATTSFLPFQETIKRKRKYDVEALSESVPLQAHLFDILSLNGQDLLNEPIENRLEKLKSIIKPGNSVFKLAETTLVKSEAELTELFEKYVAENLEGLIAKGERTIYKPGTRNFDWIKLKASAKSELVDTIDAVVLGYYAGRGVRNKFGIGALLIGTYDKEKDVFISLSKLGTGFKDADWGPIKTSLDAIKVDALLNDVKINKSLMPDVLVKPEIVVVVEADSISKSKMHGNDSDADSYSLRFPRIKQFGRDKSPEDITNTKEMQRLFELQ